MDSTDGAGDDLPYGISMDFNPEKIQAFLDMLIETGVEEFEGFGMHIRFTAGLFTRGNEAEDHPARSEEREVPSTLWETPELWPGGKAPQFPSKKK
jgi:hypothetical protein